MTISLASETAPRDQQSASTCGVEMLDKGRVPGPGGTEWVGERFHHATQKGHNLKVMACLLLELFCLIFLDHSGPRVTETTEREIAGKGHGSIATMCWYTDELEILRKTWEEIEQNQTKTE